MIPLAALAILVVAVALAAKGELVAALILVVLLVAVFGGIRLTR